tara:strand:- start:288 stop:530 length:243 start_codon:yes stop_codon:yes gene_type:complete
MKIFSPCGDHFDSGDGCPRPGDLFEYRCPKFGIVWQWRIHGIYLGAIRQEGLIEVSDVAHERVMVPEPMTRGLTLVRMVS